MGDTIIDLKKSFLSTQIRILNAPLEPSHHWRHNAPLVAEHGGELGEKVVREVVHKLNSILRHHNRSVYSSQAIRHVAEQIDALYWASGAPDPDSGEIEDGDGVLSREADLRDPGTIAALPETWTQEATDDDSQLEQFVESQRYLSLHTHLTALSTTYQTLLSQTLPQYRALQTLLQPLRNPLENLQPNLVTRDGELGREVERMKVLIARVGEKVGGLEGRGERGEGSG